VIRLIKSCVQLGLAPETDTLLYMSPADVVSDAIVAIALNEEVRNRSFHLVPEAPLTGEELFAHMRALGYPLRRCKYSEWFDALLESTKHSQENALAPFIPFLTDNLGETAPLLDSTNTRAALERSPVRIPTLTRELLEVYFKYFLESGFIEQGEHELAS